jgi:hypothetical protein
MKIRILSAMITCLALTSAALADDLTEAFTGCLNENVLVSQGTAEKPASAELRLKKVAVDGSSNSVVNFTCSGPKAERLFEHAGRFSSEEDKYWSGGDRVISRKFGNLSIASQCNRRIRNTDGSEANHYWCNIMVDLVGDMIKAMNLK